MREKTKARKSARWRALIDVTELIAHHMKSGTGVQFAYYSNEFALEKNKTLYSRELELLLTQLHNRAVRIQQELFEVE